MKFAVKDQPNTYILSWTTTPWTLPGNVALAVGADITYVKAKKGDSTFILAKNLAHKVLGDDIEIIEEVQGSALEGIEYVPLFDSLVGATDKKAFYVALADFVTIEDGTGVVHTAVMYGEDDYNLGLEIDLPAVHTVNEDGRYNERVPQ